MAVGSVLTVSYIRINHETPQSCDTHTKPCYVYCICTHMYILVHVHVYIHVSIIMPTVMNVDLSELTGDGPVVHSSTCTCI